MGSRSRGHGQTEGKFIWYGTICLGGEVLVSEWRVKVLLIQVKTTVGLWNNRHMRIHERGGSITDNCRRAHPTLRPFFPTFVRHSG